jgi:hypothetical protein
VAFYQKVARGPCEGSYIVVTHTAWLEQGQSHCCHTHRLARAGTVALLSHTPLG